RADAARRRRRADRYDEARRGRGRRAHRRARSRSYTRVTYGDSAWAFSRLWLQPLTKLFTRARLYGRERIPAGGCVLAVNHLHWVDLCVVGATYTRTMPDIAHAE